jgi:RHS repeat-associated protein
MKKTQSTTPLRTGSIGAVLFLIALVVLSTRAVNAQDRTTNPVDGHTPTGLQAGSPTGSFPLSGFDLVSPFSGNLNFSLPLIKAGGRGTPGFTLQQPIATKWTVTYTRIDSGTGQYWEYFEPTLNAGPQPRLYGAGVLVGRQAQDNIIDYYCYYPNEPYYLPLQTLTRLTWVGPDGTSFDFRDQALQGAPANVPYCATSGTNRGKVFITTDGQSATFISDDDIYDSIMISGSAQWISPSGYIKWKDGTVYRIDYGEVTWIRDRNGNKLSFSYNGYQQMVITDSLNRQITVEYGVTDPTYGLCNRIKYKGFGGAQRTIWITLGPMSTALRSGYSIQNLNALFPEMRNASPYQFNPYVPTAVWLPNGKKYKFYYNNYGEIARVELPTGGAYEYDWAAGLVGGAASGATCSCPTWALVYRRVLERRVYSNGGTGTSFDRKMTFSRPETWNAGGNFGNLGYVVVNQTNSSGTLLTSEKHYYYGGAFTSMLSSPIDYSNWDEGKEYQADVFSNDGTTVLRTTTTSWAQRYSVGWWAGYGAGPSADPLVMATTNTLVDTNQVSQTAFSYDQFNNRTSVREYDWGAGAPGSLLRETQTTYLTTNPVNSIDYTTNSVHILDLPIQASTYGVGGERARLQMEYDNYATDTNHAGLLNRANISGFDSTFNTSYTSRGNATAVTRHIMVNGSSTGSATSYSQYDIAGSPIREIDPRSTPSNVIATTIEYDDRYGIPDTEARSNSAPTELTGFTSFGFPTKAINTLGHTSYAQYDYYLGLAVNGEDVNGVVASGYFNDSLDRPTQVRRAAGTGAESRTTFAYDDTLRIITTTNDRDSAGDNLLVSKVFYDLLGRTIETRQYEGGDNFISKQTQYDSLDRPFKTSNPFRPWQSESLVWTTQAFDALGRVISVTTPDNAVVTTSYQGNSVTVTDPAAKRRKSVSDALGRLTDVWEDPQPQNPSGLNYQTSYAYDPADNVVKVTQGSQQRFFMYDSLKRLIRSRTPEQSTLAGLNLSDSITGNSAWSVAYQYDADGNLTQKSDARGVVSTYAYDALNRNTTVDYSDTTSINPDVKRFYDGATNGKGRFWYFYKGGDYATGPNVDHTAIDSYDLLGRPLVQRQLFKLNGTWSATYQTSRAYNAAGRVTSQTYPSGHTISYTYDTAGRTSTFSGYLGDGAQRTYATDITYSSWGPIGREQFGTTTPLYHKAFYNIRGQLFDTRLSSVNDLWDWNRGRLILYYSNNHIWGQSGTDNNGNVRFAENWIPPENATLDQAHTLMEDVYSYDGVNRLTSVAEQRISVDNGWVWQQQFRQQYVYDRWGNRTIDAGQTWGIGVNNKQFTVDSNTNRLGVPNGQPGVMSYDPAGNLITDSYSGAGIRTYDADNRMITATDNTGQISRYTYDADGRRSRVQVASSQEQWHISGFDGELLADYPALSPANAPEKEYGYRNGELLISATGRFNVALAANGAIATASSAHTCCGFSTTGAINGNNRGPWGNGEGWNDATPDVVPDWIQVDFAGSKLIDEISVFSLHDNYTVENTPTETQTFTLYGLLSFNVQYWNGSSWITVPGGTVTGNNKVWRKFTFSPITTNKIRVWISAVPDSWSRVVEIQAFGTSASGEKVQWLLADHLGTPRMVVDQTGSLANLKRHDYLPFGEELFPPAGGRSAALGYSGGDGVRQQFTRKERDWETGLDYFGARYYANVQGRFTSPDPISLDPTRLFDPQRINRYGYARQNPLLFLDPDGEDLVPTNPASATQLRTDLDKVLTKAEAANITVKAGQNVGIINPAAITNPSPAYERLLLAIKPGVIREYNAVAANSVQTLKDGSTINISAGMIVYTTPTLIEIFVPTTDGPQVWGADGITPVDLPREIVTAHEALGHATCGTGLCAVDIENKIRVFLGLPERSGSEHDRNPGEAQRPGQQIPPTQVTITGGSTDLIPTPGPPPPTFIVPKPPRKPPQPN